ncbi:MAG: ribonuclease Z [Deltaproteobacteria bacterium]|nr:ribonuclease Z [Deltaproteobacteria bacterium]
MHPTFFPRLVNNPFDDPGLFIPFLLEKRAVIFDLGNIDSLSAKDILKISHVFITHTHMDHFIGFDRLLRLLLGREQHLHMYGPSGFLKNVEGKLSAYSWNLVKHYSNVLTLHITEVHPEHLITNVYLCQEGFLPASNSIKRPFNGILHQEASLTVLAEILDHGIPCLGFTIKERFHVNIVKESVSDLGLEIGPWLNDFKKALFSNQHPDSEFEINDARKHLRKKKFIMGDLANRIARITPGQKISYVADVMYSPSNVEKMLKLAKLADHLFIEAAFLEKDKDMAKKKCHLTAWQAGSIAAKARVKQFTPFHFSPRYTGSGHLLEAEARAAYESAG